MERSPLVLVVALSFLGCTFGSVASPSGAADRDTIVDHPGNGEESGEEAAAPTHSEENQSLTFRNAMPPTAMGKEARANQYANLSGAACKAEIKRRALPASDARAEGVLFPMRLTGPLHGVRFLTAAAPSPFGVADCRLLLALDDFSKLLSGFNVVGVQLDSMFRPRAHIAGKKKMTSQHARGLAADIVAFTFKGRGRIAVEGNWGASVGTIPCGPAAVLEERSDEILLLREVACATGRLGVFHHLLTPSFDAAHRNHFHFDIKRDSKQWSLR